MDDLISRQAAIDAIRREVIAYKVSLESPFLNNREKEDLRIRKSQALEDMVAIETLPSAERRGRWVRGDEMADYPRVPYKPWETYCSCCGEIMEQSHYNFCGNCGAKMEEECENESR